MAHRKIGERHPSRLIDTMRPFYLRSVHDDNDSRALHDRTTVSQAGLAEAFRYFPFLSQDLAPDGQGSGLVAE